MLAEFQNANLSGTSFRGAEITDSIFDGANIDQAGDEGTTPLYMACQKRHVDAVRLLLKTLAKFPQPTSGAQIWKRPPQFRFPGLREFARREGRRQLPETGHGAF